MRYCSGKNIRWGHTSPRRMFFSSGANFDSGCNLCCFFIYSFSDKLKFNGLKISNGRNRVPAARLLIYLLRSRTKTYRFDISVQKSNRWGIVPPVACNRVFCQPCRSRYFFVYLLNITTVAIPTKPACNANRSDPVKANIQTEQTHALNHRCPIFWGLMRHQEVCRQTWAETHLQGVCRRER